MILNRIKFVPKLLLKISKILKIAYLLDRKQIRNRIYSAPCKAFREIIHNWQLYRHRNEKLIYFLRLYFYKHVLLFYKSKCGLKERYNICICLIYIWIAQIMYNRYLLFISENYKYIYISQDKTHYIIIN